MIFWAGFSASFVSANEPLHDVVSAVNSALTGTSARPAEAAPALVPAMSFAGSSAKPLDTRTGIRERGYVIGDTRTGRQSGSGFVVILNRGSVIATSVTGPYFVIESRIAAASPSNTNTRLSGSG